MIEVIKAVFISWLIYMILLVTLWIRVEGMNYIKKEAYRKGYYDLGTTAHIVAMLVSFFVSVVITVITIFTM